jgi:putative alpha-1,2-mannosidase
VPQFYEASSWECAYNLGPCWITRLISPAADSFLAANDMATIVDLMGGAETFIKRLDHGWDREYLDIGE